MKKNRKKNNKNYKLYAIIAVLVFFGAGYWIFQNKMRSAEASVAYWDTVTTGTSWQVPTGVTEIMVKVWGAGGGSGAGGDKGGAGGDGGGGGYAEALISVTAGNTLTVMTGGGGAAGTYTGGGTKKSTGGGGGGYSAVKDGTTVLIQAGGGGGGGAGSTDAAYTGGAGGAGGGTSGTAGTQGANTCDASGTSGGEEGSGGTQSAGGSAGSACNTRTGDGQAGSLNQGGYGGVTGGGGAGGTNGGGAGGNYDATAGDSGAGGGGGGYYGGGGGEVGAAMGGGGGGGGSATSTGSSIVLTAGSGTSPANSSDYYYTTYCATDAGVGATGGVAGTNGSAGNVGCVVIIYNSASPAFSGDPVANPSIGGAGDTITFSATSTDADGDNWYLAVCKTNSITPGTPPTCASGETVCVSTATSSSASGNTCEWTVDGAPGEMDWYAFACDDTVGMEKCSSANTTNSPFTVIPGDSQVTLEDIYCAATGCTPATYNLDSPAEATSTMYDLQEIYDAVSDVYYYPYQKNLIWDDAKGAASSTENSLSYAYSNSVDQNKEEGEWTAYTDSNLGTETIASGAVYKDERTGLYWSHCYSAAQDGTCDTITNEFTLNGVIADTDDGLDAEGGNAVDFCESLSLDADGDGTDETDWYLPSQKELMQAYINGAGNNMPARFFWSSTERASNSSDAWLVALSHGNTYNNTKTYYASALCVRR